MNFICQINQIKIQTNSQKSCLFKNLVRGSYVKDFQCPLHEVHVMYFYFRKNKTFKILVGIKFESLKKTLCQALRGRRRFLSCFWSACPIWRWKSQLARIRIKWTFLESSHHSESNGTHFIHFWKIRYKICLNWSKNENR